MMSENGQVRRRRRRSTVQRKRMLKRYMMIALLMGTVGFLIMVVEELLDYSEERSGEHIGFSDDVPNASHSALGEQQGRDSGRPSSQQLTPEQIQKMKRAAEVLGIIK
ncbi:MAG: hypothetical protein Q9M13_08620 [Mariprofundales bacterium]|nr:hypothetical protein [Mariprofundales bacterium]